MHQLHCTIFEVYNFTLDLHFQGHWNVRITTVIILVHLSHYRVYLGWLLTLGFTWLTH